MARGRKRKPAPVQKTVQRQQPPISVNYLNIERIIDVHECQVVYRVRWPNTLENEENVLGCEALQRFLDGTDENEVDDDENEVSEFQPGADDKEYEVHKILEKRIVERKVKYYVKWKDTWENDDEIDPDLIDKFNEEKNQQHQLDNDEENNQEEQHSEQDEQLDQEQEEQQQFDYESERDDAEYDLQWVDGGEHQEEEDQQFDSNRNHKEKATTSKNKRKRCDDMDDANEIELKTKRFRMVDDDDVRIKRILNLAKTDDGYVFIFDRLDGRGTSVMSVDMAKKTNSDKVIEFYESRISLKND